MNTNSINTLQAAIVSSFAAVLTTTDRDIYSGQFTDLAARKTNIIVPALWVNFERGQDTQYSGTEQIDIKCTFTAYAITRVINDIHKRNQDAQSLAQQALLILKNNRFGLTDVDVPKEIALRPLADSFFINNALGVVALSWTQVVRLGDSIFDSTAITPTEVWLGQAPKIGTGFEPDYDQIV